MRVFFNTLRSKLGPLNQKQVDGIITLMAVFARRVGITLQHQAYMLGTAWHETAFTMQPIPERGKKSYFNKYEPTTKIGKSLGNTLEGDGYKFRGRGYVQITGRSNYAKFSKRLGLDLVSHPDHALEPGIAANILIEGCLGGMFTGKSLFDYKDFVSMRRVVNGTDKAQQIAKYATHFEEALKAQRAASKVALEEVKKTVIEKVVNPPLFTDPDRRPTTQPHRKDFLMEPEVVTVNPPAVSKINWTAGVGFIVSVLAIFGLDITPEMQNIILQGITLVGLPLIMILRTFFTKHVS